MTELNITKFPHLSTLEKDKQVEYVTPVEGQVTGEIPLWLRGSWYRNGPGVIHFKEQSVTHWFDGMALPRRFEIKDGKAFYRSRFVQGQSFQRNTQAGRVAVPEFGTHVQTKEKASFFSKAMTMISLPEFTDNCLINIMRVGEYLFAISETNLIRRLNPETLETMERVDLSKYMPINLMSSNPLYDSEGSIYNFTTSIFSMGKTKYNLVTIPKPEQGSSLKQAFTSATCVGSVDSSWRVSPSYHHSFCMSTNYALFVEMPLKLSIPKMAVAHWSNMCYSDCMESHSDLNTNIYVIDKRSGKFLSTNYATDPMIVYQSINAYEKDGQLVMDICCYDDIGFFDKFSMKNLTMDPQEFQTTFDTDSNRVKAKRFVLPLDVTKATKQNENLVTLPDSKCTAIKDKNGDVFLTGEVLADGTEYPAINTSYTSKPYRYFYSSGGECLPPGEKIVKIDTEEKKKVYTWEEKGCWVSQTAFVQRPEAKDEDDGILLSSVTCEDAQPFLLILDANSFEEIARVRFDANIPPDIHGIFVPDA